MQTKKPQMKQNKHDSGQRRRGGLARSRAAIDEGNDDLDKSHKHVKTTSTTPPTQRNAYERKRNDLQMGAKKQNKSYLSIIFLSYRVPQQFVRFESRRSSERPRVVEKKV